MIIKPVSQWQPPPRGTAKKDDSSTHLAAALAWYVLLGALHEVAHLTAHWALMVLYYGQPLMSHVPYERVLEIVFQAVLGRCSVFHNPDDDLPFLLDATRHAGWIFSLSLGVYAYYWRTTTKTIINGNHNDATSSSSPSPFALAAYIVAAEAITTDLLCLLPRWTPPTTAAVLFCGNFGIILINQAWVSSDGGKTALDVLEKMVNVTMMRGAQCGGAVTFVDDGPGTTRKAIRSRVVNAKRSDLSEGIRHKIEKDACNSMGKLVGNPRGFFGHTRFATSSKATFDGTHPHQWTPKTKRQVYGPFAPDSTVPPTKSKVAVENFITHNGDLDFFQVNGSLYDLGTVQKWLELATEAKMPTTVDSAAIAGLVDLLRTQGCFGLSARYALCFGLSTSKIDPHPACPLPTYQEYERIGSFFETALDHMLSKEKMTLDNVSSQPEKRKHLAEAVYDRLFVEYAAAKKKWNVSGAASDARQLAKLQAAPYFALSSFIQNDDEAGGASLFAFVQVTIDAFFDNDLFNTTKVFLANAKGSFGLGVISNLDAHRQFCIAARGQPMSVAFYPRKGLVCYGSEQAAVKAGLNYSVDSGIDEPGENATRLDLDDLGGEICLLDWGHADSHVAAISVPNRNLKAHKLMGGSLTAVLLRESITVQASSNLHSRMTLLEGNEWVKALNTVGSDPVLSDIQDIPRVCSAIQKDWQEIGLNRLTAWNFTKTMEARMKAIADGRVTRSAGSVDILLTGCEVSLWLAEQFASDLEKAFPNLYIKAISSNKLLGVFGQDLTIPCIGYPLSQKTNEFVEPIVIIVSHSGGTFAPLACSNLLQSFTRNIFVVTSEWDTQIGKQLRGMYDKKDMVSSRIFTTEVGVRPAEPCSVSVAATQQLLTNIFIHMCNVVVCDQRYRHVTGAVVTESDLQTLEKLNRRCIGALEDIVGVDRNGDKVPTETSQTESELRSVGDLWADHILENARAYLMSFIYIVATVTTGYPLISGIATAAGLDTDWAFYITRFFDSLIYFWLPQINVIILRLLQGRNLRHRMVGRTVAIGDCPWVAQSAEAFLSKIFACSYSIAGLNVISGNPADHLVHRHTHRVVRGTLLVCGRPDGRLSALTSLEATACLSVNQASSIISIGGTCESVTIGHNPFKLPLSHRAVFLNAHRPKFMCETVLAKIDEEEARARGGLSAANAPMQAIERGLRRRSSSRRRSSKRRLSTRGLSKRMLSKGADDSDDDSTATSMSNNSSHGRLMGVYSNLLHSSKKEKTEKGTNPAEQSVHSPDSSCFMEGVIGDMIKEKSGIQQLREIFDRVDEDGSGTIDLEEFIRCFHTYEPSMPMEAVAKLFHEADVDKNGTLDFEEFVNAANMPHTDMVAALSAKNRTDRGLAFVEPSDESYFGEHIREKTPNSISSFSLAESQAFSMELFESRIASLQRFVSMTVMFHQMGKRVQEFFPRISFGLLGYRMDRTHSIMRIATTASPVSGADVRERMEVLRMQKTVHQSLAVISRAWIDHKEKYKKVKEAYLKSGKRHSL